MPSIARILLTTLIFACGLVSAQTPSANTASVYIISPSHGEVVSSPISVKFGLTGMGIAPAGVERDNTGHHHLLIDLDELPPADKPIPADDQHKHFGGGQTETTIELPPGKHTLQLMLADYKHVPHDPKIASEKITIIVKSVVK